MDVVLMVTKSMFYEEKIPGKSSKNKEISVMN